MTIFVLVEGASELAFLTRWIPRLLPGQDVRVHPHQGKGSLPTSLDATPDPRNRALLNQLPAKLRGFARDLRTDMDSVLVLVDADDDDRDELARSIEDAAKHCAPSIRFAVSVAVEETEAFYLGDLRALLRAYPEADMATARQYTPDSICGTWELFGQVIGDGGGNKVKWAEAMGPFVTIRASQSRSPSFRRALEKLQALADVKVAPRKRRNYRHIPKTQR